MFYAEKYGSIMKHVEKYEMLDTNCIGKQDAQYICDWKDNTCNDTQGMSTLGAFGSQWKKTNASNEGEYGCKLFECRANSGNLTFLENVLKDW